MLELLHNLQRCVYHNLSICECRPIWRRFKDYRIGQTVQDGQKTGTLFVRLNFTHLNFIKYWPIFKLISV